MSKILVGVDVGTSGCKCILADETGKVLASATKEYPLYTPKPGWAEQNPADWWQGVKDGLKDILSGINKEELVGISFSGQMHGLVALDENGEVIRPSILWCDQRTQKQC
ncbi:MAG: xylulokinase, partial [Clostridia bacterium]|nr:xylulokinase [Clostridia bacterium]